MAVVDEMEYFKGQNGILTLAPVNARIQLQHAKFLYEMCYKQKRVAPPLTSTRHMDVQRWVVSSHRYTPRILTVVVNAIGASSETSTLAWPKIMQIELLEQLQRDHEDAQTATPMTMRVYHSKLLRATKVYETQWNVEPEKSYFEHIFEPTLCRNIVNALQRCSKSWQRLLNENVAIQEMPTVRACGILGGLQQFDGNPQPREADAGEPELDKKIRNYMQLCGQRDVLPDGAINTLSTSEDALQLGQTAARLEKIWTSKTPRQRANPQSLELRKKSLMLNGIMRKPWKEPGIFSTI